MPEEGEPLVGDSLDEAVGVREIDVLEPCRDRDTVSNPCRPSQSRSDVVEAYRAALAIDRRSTTDAKPAASAWEASR